MVGSARGRVRRLDLLDELFAVTAALEAAGLPYALCGGLAVAVHGHVRATRDIDLLVLPEHRDAILAALAPLGFTLPALPMTFSAGTPVERQVQRVSKAGATGLVTVDLLLVGPALASVWEQRTTFGWQARRLTVVSRPGLLAMKRLAGRLQDLADIEHLTEGGDER